MIKYFGSHIVAVQARDGTTAVTFDHETMPALKMILARALNTLPPTDHPELVELADFLNQVVPKV